MSRTWWLLAWCLLPYLANWTAAAEPLAQPWQTPYAGEHASGPQVLGFWRFEPEGIATDSGPRKHASKLNGAVAVPQGKFGGGLESFAGWPTSDKQHALVVANHPALTPAGAFTAELWFSAKPELASASLAYLIDKKYASQNDFQWLLAAPDKSGARRMIVNLGFGVESESFASEPIPFAVGEWHHLAFSYDGQGTVRFYRDGSTAGQVARPGRRSVVGGAHGLSIGDRLGSNYGGCPAILDEVRLCQGSLEFSPASVALVVGRRSWLRGEPNPEIEARVRNLRADPLTGARLTISGFGETGQPVALPEIAGGGEHVHKLSFDTMLRPDVYELRARLEVPGDTPIQREDTLSLTLAARRPPFRMPVMMWGIGSPSEFARELPRLQELGFNHCLGFSSDAASIWRAKEPIAANSPEAIAATNQMLDTALANQFGIAASLYPGAFLKQQLELGRVDRMGKPYSRHDCNAALPGLAEYSHRFGASVAKTFGHHPAFTAALVNSEVRDDSEISFSQFDRDAYRKFSGTDFPAEVMTKYGVAWKSLPNFPADRVVPDDHPVLRFYRWFWTVGDGWNGLHTALHRGLKSTGRDDIWTWYDPAIRVPSVAGSGGEVDVLSQWTYTEPSPLRVGYFADEVFAMANLSPRPQQVMKMTQLFWYRSSSAPKGNGNKHVASPFDDHDPDAAYISISPMHLRESFWTKIARPVSGLMYHGWSSLVPTDGTHAYKYTQPDLQTEFRRLHHEVLEPLGPMLLQVPDRAAEVAYLDSFTSQVFARRGSFGYSHDEAYLTLLHAQLQPRVVFEETIQRQGLEGFKILVLVDCDVLPASVVTKIGEFQQRGGIVIGDPNLAPAIKADVTLPRFARTRQTDQDKAAILANAAQLRTALDARFSRFAESSNPEIVVRTRGTADSDYVFLVNDRREFGEYVGQHGLVMENGLPSDGFVRVRRSEGHVYDLRAGRKIAADQSKGYLVWPVKLGPCDGGLFLVAPRPIERLQITCPETVRLGEPAPIRVLVTDARGQVVPAVLPIQIEILDPAGRPAERSGYYGAAGGTLDLKLEIARNDLPGLWQIRVRDLASGLVDTGYLRVAGQTRTP